VSGELPTSEPFNRALIQRLHDTLARAIELQETFEAQHRLPVHAASRLRRDEAEAMQRPGSTPHLPQWWER
jgi:hypothetical protein